MNIISVALLILTLLVGGAFPALAAFTPTEWKYYKEIEANGAATEFMLLDLDAEVFDKSSAGLADIRITKDGVEIPYAMYAEKSDRRYIAVPATLKDLSSSAATVSFILDVSPGASGAQLISHNRVDIRVTGDEFRKNVTVEGSTDRNQWRYLTSRGQIFRFTIDDGSPRVVQSTTVDYPESTARFLRVTIGSGDGAMPKVTGASVFQDVQVRAREISYTPAIASRSTDGQVTNIVFDLGSRGIPSHAITVTAAEEWFTRSVRISAGDDVNNLRPIGSGTIFQVRGARASGESINVSSLTLGYPEQTTRYIQLTIENGDNPELTIPSAVIKGVGQKVVFEYQPQHTYRLYYGNTTAVRPNYELSALLKYLEVSNFDYATLGSEKMNDAYQEPPPPVVPVSERIPLLIPFTLGIIVAALAFFTFRLLKGAHPNSPNPPGAGV